MGWQGIEPCYRMNGQNLENRWWFLHPFTPKITVGLSSGLTTVPEPVSTCNYWLCTAFKDVSHPVAVSWLKVQTTNLRAGRGSRTLKCCNEQPALNHCPCFTYPLCATHILSVHTGDLPAWEPPSGSLRARSGLPVRHPHQQSLLLFFQRQGDTVKCSDALKQVCTR